MVSSSCAGMHFAQQGMPNPSVAQVPLPNLNSINLMQALPAFQQAQQQAGPSAVAPHFPNAAALGQLGELGVKLGLANQQTLEQAEKQQQRRERRCVRTS